MQLEVGPVEASQVQSWAKCLRRLLIDLRVASDSEDGFDPDVLDSWGQLADIWADECINADGDMRWVGEIESARAEYLLHGILSITKPGVASRSLTPDELKTHTPFTRHVINAFIDGLEATAHCDQNYLEQVRSAMRMASLKN